MESRVETITYSSMVAADLRRINSSAISVRDTLRVRVHLRCGAVREKEECEEISWGVHISVEEGDLSKVKKVVRVGNVQGLFG